MYITRYFKLGMPVSIEHPTCVHIYTMAIKIFFAFFLCLLVSCALALPFANDSKSVRSSDSVDERLMESTSELDIVKVLSQGEDSDRETRQVGRLQSVSSLGAVVGPSLADSEKSLRRSKRKVITGSGCPDGMIWFTKCMSYAEYELLQEADEFK